MEGNNKPITSEEFNKKIREENSAYSNTSVETTKVNPIIIILIIVFILAFIAGCIILGFAIIHKDKTKTPDEPIAADTIVNLTETDIKGYTDIMDKIDFAKNDKSSFSVFDLDNQQILRIGLSEELESKGYFNSEELSKNIKLQLGDISYKDEPIKCLVCGNATYKYAAEEKVYEQAPSTDHGHGGVGTYHKKKYFISATKNETKGTLDINMKIIYGDLMDEMGFPTSNLYLTLEDAKAKKNGLLETNEVDGYEKDKYDEVYEANKDKIPVTTYHFEKDSSGNYVFKKVSVK